jgi:hypothetical protein
MYPGAPDPDVVPGLLGIDRRLFLSTEDRLINPDLQRYMAKRMGASLKTVPSSRASLIAHPTDTANLTLEA